METWIGLQTDKVIDLELELEDLRERLSEGVASLVGPSAVEAATRSADHDKLERLAVAVTNVVRDNEAWTGYEDHAQTMMRLLDETTTTQFALLEYLDDPVGWLQKRGLSLSVALSDDGRLPHRGRRAGLPRAR